MRDRSGWMWAMLLATVPVWANAATPPPAPVEAHVPFAPSAFLGSDGHRHLAYELHVSNFYGDTGALAAQDLQVFADDGPVPLLHWDPQALARQIRPTPAQGSAASIAAGARSVIFVWITLPDGRAMPRRLRHVMDLRTVQGTPVRLDGAALQVATTPPPTLGPPLRGGDWLAHEGPGAAQSHHWGSLVAVNGALTIPQRYALDLVGVDASGRALRHGTRALQRKQHSDWIGYGWDVVAVADGIVRGSHDGEPEYPPLTAQPEPAALTADTLFGNHVILEIAPGVFASYAHLKTGSVRVKPGDHVVRGQVVAQLGQSGNSAAPHLHFQLSDQPTFEGAEGVPYTFEHFHYLGPESEAQLFPGGPAWHAAPAQPRQQQLPLNDVVVRFPLH
ncbi:M23 family metallopeptidase [Stenotrophomonas sp. 24(2023)]|uniref:M23 family metallopeptidase n=1 Tax=Stenotrophomonas sp. 24(2023) TaxID=3068324 RepID=UPI0027DEBB14|nr:M23 family metallopeptidase [Stenotrophomonas sp. 24(2023)]WMJ69276.1 M23 family metallopeptidase [Stenotrophomonas sp. 24(2023)]